MAGSFEVTGEVVVAADPPLVERFLLDSGCFATWHRGLAGAPRISTPVLQIGTSVEFTGRVGPLRLPYVTIVSGHQPGRMISLRTTRGLVDLLTQTTWRAVEGGTRVTTVVQGRCTAAKAWILPWGRRLLQRNVRLELEDARRLLETGRFEFTAPSALTPHPPHCTGEPPGFP